MKRKELLSKFLFIYLFLHLNTLHANPEKAAIDTIKALFPGLGTSRTIKTKGCAINKNKWLSALLTKESFVEEIDFNKNCDLKGKYKVRVDQFFPLKMKIRGLKNYSNIKTQMRLAIVFEDKAVLKLEMKKAKLSGVNDLHFNMDYKVLIDPLSDNPLGKHQGGNLYLKRYGNKVLNKKVPLVFQ